MAKLKLKKFIQIAFFAAVAIAVLVQLASVYSRWRAGREIRAEIWKSARAAVLKTDPRFPPGLLVEFANGSRYAIDKARFRLTFLLGAQEVAAAERDFREVKPGKTEHVLLKSVEVPRGSAPPPPGTRLAYRLVVFPGQRKPLPEITGGIEVR
ncbi:MAG: hypothetical protein A2W03_10260 [Candidatus Aminicenantes bacterium RBG_16_63_16]|nr:MAG: hypothetical protein A2W03_10260 [Candidatus Aminicenantes bacterium RBG_16_63_16]